MQTVDQRVLAALGRHPSVRSVALAGSRADGRATPRSDWDFVAHADDFEAVARDLPALCAPLDPIAQQWDRLSSHPCWMLMLHGPTKVDVIFPDEPHRPEPPWQPTRENLSAIDVHFWDWVLWLGGKEGSGKRDLVAAELPKLFEHLLAPLGIRHVPGSIAEAVAAYRTGRAEAERRLGVEVSLELEHEVVPALGV